MLLKKDIRKYIFFLLSTFVLVSCTTDSNSLAFVIPDNQAEIAKIELSSQSPSTSFYYSILAREMMIEWGDGSRNSEYVYNDIDWVSIRPIEHLYTQAGTYSVNVRTSSPRWFNFSKNDSSSLATSITKLDLVNCYTLSELYCRNQPLSDLDLSSCDSLSVLDIANASVSNLTLKSDNRIKHLNISNTALALFDAQSVPFVRSLSIGSQASSQEVVNIETLSDLRQISINGKITKTNLDLSLNDSLQTVEALASNIEELNIQQLTVIDSLSLKKCADLTSIKMGSNSNLSQITLIDNTSLAASALDNIFAALPLITNRKATILLSGNAGDNACDRSIATAKGWVFE